MRGHAAFCAFPRGASLNVANELSERGNEIKIMRRDELSRKGNISTRMYPLVLPLFPQQQTFDERAEMYVAKCLSNGQASSDLTGT